MAKIIPVLRRPAANADVVSDRQCEKAQSECRPVALMVSVWLCGLKAGCDYLHREKKKKQSRQSITPARRMY